MSFTINDIRRELKIDPDKRAAWRIGAEARDIFIERNGYPPPKVLRPKTTGAGSHCFALYPEHFRKVVEQLWLPYVKASDPDAPPPEGMLL